MPVLVGPCILTCRFWFDLSNFFLQLSLHTYWIINVSSENLNLCVWKMIMIVTCPIKNFYTVYHGKVLVAMRPLSIVLVKLKKFDCTFNSLRAKKNNFNLTMLPKHDCMW